MQLLSLGCSTLPLILTLYCWVLSKVASSTIFWVFGITRPGIEPKSPRSLGNTLTIAQRLSTFWIIISSKIWLFFRLNAIKPFLAWLGIARRWNPFCHNGYHHHHHYHIVLLAQISLTLSRHPSLSSIAPGRSFRLHHVSPESSCI